MSLVAEYDEIARAVARRLGYPLTSFADSGRSQDEETSLEDAIRCGLRWFYFPSGEISHEWTFLRKYLSISLTSGVNWYALPSDFERIAGDVGVTTNKHPLSMTSEAGIRLRLNSDAKSGTPEYCAVRTTQAVSDTRYEIGVYPTPTEGTLDLWYLFDPGTITDSSPEPAGGALHSETILAACLAAAEAQMNPEQIAGESGVHMQYFMQKLAESVAADRVQAGVI